MEEKEGKLPRANEIPICPFCDGKVYYTAWVTHKIFQMECESCKAHWRTGFEKDSKQEMYVELTKPTSNGEGIEFLNRKLSMEFWKDMIRERIKIQIDDSH